MLVAAVVALVEKVAEPLLAFVDMEGQSDKGQSYDIKLSTPLLLIAKVMILNFVCPTGPERETILNKLAIMMHAGETVSEERDRAFGPLPCLAANHIIQVSRLHVNSLFRYQDNLGDALAEANREGEEARREERLRIWGYA